MRTKYLLTLAVCLLFGRIALSAPADDGKPSISPYGVMTDKNGKENTDSTFSGSAPMTVRFYANAKNADGWNTYYEWRFFLTDLRGNESDTPYLIRYEEDTEYTFTKAGLNKIVCYAVFTNGNDTVNYTDEYWSGATPLTVSISESQLEMPNAFSPNGDGHNDIYRAKQDKLQSIVEFHAYIYNRWGQLLYEWTDPYNGWDGTYHGKDVKQGVYFCLVKAKGADGKKFNIRTDVNLLRGFTESTDSNPF